MFSITQTPLKTCLLYFEVLQLFTHYFSILKSLIKAKQEKIVDLSKSFIEEIETEEEEETAGCPDVGSEESADADAHGAFQSMRILLL